jgi:hypothetical protein
MKRVDHQILLNDLRESLDRIKALTAWHDLKKSEQQGVPPTFLMHDPTPSDISNEYSRMVGLSFQMHSALAGKKVPTIMVMRTRHEYLSIMKELNSLNIGARISQFSY